MKKTVTVFAAALCAAMMSSVVYADTLITSPIDSRPISNEYLGNLAAVGGDRFISINDEYLDLYSNDLSASRQGNSAKVREELADIVAKNNKRSSTVIINSSSYFTNGLVGGRCGKNYADWKNAMTELEDMLEENTEPTYYFNLCMPRSLPETRFNELWLKSDDPTKRLGIAYFYLKHNKNADDAAAIRASYGEPDPSQYLLEYGYVENKAFELGENALTPWETEFLHYFRDNFVKNKRYSDYVNYYKEPYTITAEMFGELMKLQQKGLLDEIIVSNDDLQLPNSIIYFASKGAEWIQTEKGTAIKYSFPRRMLVSDNNSIYKRFDRVYGSRERSNALVGRGKNINILFGVDEVPQLIYARSLAKKENLTADFNLITESAEKTAGKFDVTGVADLVANDMNFVSTTGSKTKRKFDLYVYNCKIGKDPTSLLASMKKNYDSGHNLGLIEVLSGKDTRMIKSIADDSNGYASVSMLSSYSAWNTNGNAVGLGIAHSQVFAVSEEKHHNPSVIVNAQLKMLAQHIYEDGIYTGHGKLALANKGYKPTVSEKEYSQTLFDLLNGENVKFEGKTYRVGNTDYMITKEKMTKCLFPWQRIFDCYVDFDFRTEKK